MPIRVSAASADHRLQMAAGRRVYTGLALRIWTTAGINGACPLMALSGHATRSDIQSERDFRSFLGPPLSAPLVPQWSLLNLAVAPFESDPF